MRVITVRWMDGQMESFEAKHDSVRFSFAFIYFKLEDSGINRHIPLFGAVRWFSIFPETHEDVSVVNVSDEPNVPTPHGPN